MTESRSFLVRYRRTYVLDDSLTKNINYQPDDNCLFVDFLLFLRNFVKIMALKCFYIKNETTL